MHTGKARPPEKITGTIDLAVRITGTESIMLRSRFARRITPRYVLAGVLFTLLFAPGVGLATARGEASRARILLLSDRAGNAAEKQRRAITLNRLAGMLQRNLQQQGLGKRCTMEVYASAQLTPGLVLSYYRRLNTGPSETLVFYGNAHGGTDLQRGLFIILGGKRLYVRQLLAAMQQKRPRQIIILWDTCATVLGSRPPKVDIPRYREPAPVLPPGDGKVLRQLLFEHRGVVVINAARKGYSSWGNTQIGDFFTLALGNLIDQPVSRFDRNGDGFVTWTEFYAALDREARRVCRAEGVYQPSQAFSLSKRDRGSRRVARR
jgi:hypothetical protein